MGTARFVWQSTRSGWQSSLRTPPTPGYWAWQVMLPMLVTAICSYGWLYGLVTCPAVMQGTVASDTVLAWLPGLVVVLAVLTSGGDILGLFFERRRPLEGDDRIRRDLKILRLMPTLVRFTAYGGFAGRADWRALGRVPRAGCRVQRAYQSVSRRRGRVLASGGAHYPPRHTDRRPIRWPDRGDQRQPGRCDQGGPGRGAAAGARVALRGRGFAGGRFR